MVQPAGQLEVAVVRAGRALSPVGRLPVYDQARGGWNGGAETTPVSATAAWITAAEWRGMMDSRPSDKLGTARALVAQTEAKAQPSLGDPV